MSYHLENEQKMIEIIFANRNKAYGAYQIRSSYGYTLFKSLSIVAAGFISIMGLALVMNKRPPEQKSSPPIVMQDSVLVVPFGEETPEPPRPKEEAHTDPPAAAEAASEEISANLQDSAIQARNTGTSMILSVSDNTGTATPVIESGTGTGTSTAVETRTGMTTGEKKIKKDFEVDRMPEFEGGMPALYDYLRSKLQYPELASDAGKQATVYVRFIVSETGKVRSVETLNKPGFGLEEEAVRVVRGIPDFKSPAYADGQPVAVYFQLPIRFTLR